MDDWLAIFAADQERRLREQHEHTDRIWAALKRIEEEAEPGEVITFPIAKNAAQSCG